MLYTGSEATNDFSYSLNLIKLGLQLVDLLYDCVEAGNLVVGHLNGIPRSIELGLGRDLGGLIQLWQRLKIAEKKSLAAALTAGNPTCSRRCEMASMTRSKWCDSSCRLPGSRRRRPWLLAWEPAGLRAWAWASCWCWRRVAMSCGDRPRRLSATDDGVAACGGERGWEEGIGHGGLRALGLTHAAAAAASPRASVRPWSKVEHEHEGGPGESVVPETIFVSWSHSRSGRGGDLRARRRWTSVDCAKLSPAAPLVICQNSMLSLY